MPPAISDDKAWQSDTGNLEVPLRTKVDASPPATTTSSRRATSTASASASPNGLKALVQADDDSDDAKDDDDDEDGEDLAEDEYIVEKIVSHKLVKGVLMFEVQWEGYEKKTDRTWESKETLYMNVVFRDYLEACGGEDEILKHSEKGTKGKKRGRPTANRAAAGKRRKANHPGDGTPPASAKAWKPPAGLWEDEVDKLDACHNGNSGKLIVYLTWKNGQKTQHGTEVIYQRCPQKMLAFYERHVTIRQ